MQNTPEKALIFGTNDNATACALRLYRAGFFVTLVSGNLSFDLHYFRNFSSVLSIGSKEINGVKAQSYADFLYNLQGAEKYSIIEFIDFLNNDRKISVIREDDLKQIKHQGYDFCIICDAFILKELNQLEIDSVTISCVKGHNTDYSILTSGPYGGQVNYKFLDLPEKKIDSLSTYMYSTREGLFIAEKNPGDRCLKGERVAKIDELEITAKCDGLIDGIARSGVIIGKDKPIISIADNGKYDAKIIPVESFLIAGGVLEAIMFHRVLNTE